MHSQDVMKIALLCFVMSAPNTVERRAEPEIESTASAAALAVHRSPYLDLLFPDGKPHLTTSGSPFVKSGFLDPPLDYSSYHCLEHLVARPVTLLVRRLPAKSETYRSIGQIHLKYRSMSILKAPRLSGPATKTKKRRKRRDHTAVRTKLQSKSNLLWKSLLKEPVDSDRDPRVKFDRSKRKDKNCLSTDTDRGDQKRKLNEIIPLSGSSLPDKTEPIAHDHSSLGLLINDPLESIVEEKVPLSDCI